jgi:hypothetical protein
MAQRPVADCCERGNYVVTFGLVPQELWASQGGLRFSQFGSVLRRAVG